MDQGAEPIRATSLPANRASPSCRHRRIGFDESRVTQSGPEGRRYGGADRRGILTAVFGLGLTTSYHVEQSDLSAAKHLPARIVVQNGPH